MAGLKILVVDDDPRNLETARAAFASVKGVEFTYTQSASEAVKQLPNHDAIITDFLLRGKDDGVHARYLSEYVGGLNSPKELVHVGNRDLFDRMLDRNRRALTEGRITPEDIIRAGLRIHPFADDPPYMQKEGVDWGDVEQVFTLLNDAIGLRPATAICERLKRRGSVTEEFGYGGLVMLEANKLGKPMVLLTSLRRHAGEDRTSTAGSLFGPVAFSPLVDAGLMTGREIMDDFIGPPLNLRAVVDADKTRGEAWQKALEYARKQREGGFEQLEPDIRPRPNKPRNKV